MQAAELYDRLEKDFILPGMTDEWAKYMQPISDFLTDNYKERSMGLVCDNTAEIDRVYTAVFPSKAVMQSIIDSGASNALLFLHHPSIWDIRNAPVVWQLMDRAQLEQFKERRVSIYNLHVPLDNYSEYSTSATLARILDITELKPFYEYYGSSCWLQKGLPLPAVPGTAARHEPECRNQQRLGVPRLQLNQKAGRL